jgi:uncharacterized damage-inducible protein DinB
LKGPLLLNPVTEIPDSEWLRVIQEMQTRIGELEYQFAWIETKTIEVLSEMKNRFDRLDAAISQSLKLEMLDRVANMTREMKL